MKDPRSIIQLNIIALIGQLYNKEVPNGAVLVETPSDIKRGDYAFPVMRAASFLGADPILTASKIRESLLKNEEIKSLFSNIEVAPPGYINFYRSRENVLAQALEFLRNNSIKFFNVGRGEKINIEFVSVNPTGPLHIGHARSAFYGDVLSNVLSVSGYDATREYYVNNAKTSSQIKSLGKTALGRGQEYKGEYLDSKISLYKEELSKIKTDSEAGYFLAGKIQEDIRSFLQEKAGIIFDVWREEEGLYKENALSETLEVLDKSGNVARSDGALWLKSDAAEEKDNVLVRSSGEYTYFMADIAYHLDKLKRGFSKMINVWGADHHGHIARMKSALNLLAGNEAELKILTTQIVRLKGGGKLSKRLGSMVLFSDLLEGVGVDAARYFYLTKSLNSQMEFDMEAATAKSNKNPVYYIQYTNARICGIQRKAESEYGARVDFSSIKNISEGREFEMARFLIRLVDVVGDTAKDFHIHRLSEYVFEISREFNQFYRDYRVIDGRAVRPERLALVALSGLVLGSALDIMGISHPEKM